jgi:hypothetical protein
MTYTTMLLFQNTTQKMFFPDSQLQKKKFFFNTSQILQV